ncbi:hypothetical protein Tco_0035589, partial [Tanacetum coccineum]
MSSGSSSQILDDPQIPALKASRAENGEDEVSLSQAVVHVDYSQGKEETLENLLIWAQNRKNDVRVKIDGIRTRNGWNFLFCGGEKLLRFRLELDVSDKIASTVVVMFDEPATELVKCSVDSLAAADEDVGLAYADDSFTCSRIAPEEVVEEDVRSSNLNTTAEVNIKEFQ